ncbi:MAG: J domain-containing protein [Chloroflexi bacterium]|nr:J domain-containing protein [Chloroflexota bacterium]
MPGDFYQILGVSHDASERDITSAYRKLARQYHPDVNSGDPNAEARFKEVNAAHDVLSDAKKRDAYNKWGDQWEHAEQLEEMQRQRGGPGGPGGFSGFGGFGGSQPLGGQRVGGQRGNIQFDFGEQFGDAGDIGDLLGNLFGGQGGARTPQAPTRGRDIEHNLTVSLREAFRGTTRTVQRGGGSRIEVTIPPGVDSGSRIKISGKGEDSPYGPQGQSGDLYLAISVDDDPVFERRGDDVHVFVDVPVTTAVLGGEAVVRSLSGSGGLALRIPPGTQNGRVFRLGGQGMPRFKREGRGDILAEVSLQLPKQLTPEQIDLFKQLRDLDDNVEPNEEGEPS